MTTSPPIARRRRHAPRSRSASRVFAALSTTWACASATAAGATGTASTARMATPSFVGELLAILVPLGLIIIALLVVLKLARRRFRLTGDGAVLSVLQILPVGPRERVVLVQTRGGRVFSIGVGAQTVTYITEMTPEDLAQRADDETVTPVDDIHTSKRR